VRTLFADSGINLNYIDTKIRLDGSVVLRLLRADNAALCLGFLHSIFRVDRAVFRPQSEMIARLTTSIEEIADEDGNQTFPRTAKEYIDIWENNGAVISRYNEENEIVYELTPEADQALLILENLGDRPQHTAGAESKLRAITMTLREIAERANPDRDARIRALEEERNNLAEQIRQLRNGEELKPDTPEQLVERYHFAVDIARQLLADFSLIRRRFLDLAKELAERHASADVSRGIILERALDVHRELNDGPLGQSFAGFREFLHSPDAQKVLYELIDKITKLDGVGREEKHGRFLQHLPRNLLNEAKSVIVQTRRLSSELRHMLDAHAITTRRETKETLTSLRALAYRLSDTPPEDDIIRITRLDANITNAEIALRQPWQAPEVLQPLGESAPYKPSEDEKRDALTMMRDLAAIEIERLERNLAERFATGDSAFRLLEMLEWYPPTNGNWLLDVIGYFEIATKKNSHYVIRNSPEHTWVYQPPDSIRRFRLPQIYFYK